MDDFESAKATAQELVILANQHGIDLAPICHTGAFLTKERYVTFWRKGDCIRYSLQGKVNVIPELYKESLGSFTGMWNEVGDLENLGHAFQFLRAWLLGGKEVDSLPARRVRSDGIS